MPSHNSVHQRVRDPVHNLIVFDTGQQLERELWDVLCSRPFQRLRRIKQLGFSELVYPGATHTRFAHSIGVFHTARELMGIVREWTGENRMQAQEQIALAAALVHDVGHGPFSHAFESVGKKLGIKLADHEQMSDQLIRESEIAEILRRLGSGFANDVAHMIKRDGEQTVYNAVVSSQFDADRLDYMRRDRLMTGTQQSAIDIKWLLANLEIANVSVGVDDKKFADVPTFVIGPKAIPAAETYVLGNFQLYPAVYFHKTTRGAEKLFAELLVRLVSVWQRTRRFSLYGRISVGRNGLDGTRRGAFRAGTERIRLGRPDSRRRRRFSGGPARAPPPAALRPAGISGRAPLRRRVCAVPAAAARGRAGPARAGGCWRRGRRGRPPARTGPARAAAPGRGRGAPGR